MNEVSIKDVVAALSKAVRPEHVQQKTLKGNQISFIPWHTVVRILNEQVPGWQGEVKQIIGDAGKVAVVYRLGIPCAEGTVWREAIGNEDEDKDGYGDPFSNAEAMAFKRAAAKFGLGLDLYRKGAPLPQSQNVPQEPLQVQDNPQERKASKAQRDEILALAGTEAGRINKLLDYYKVSGLQQLTEKQAEHAIARLQRPKRAEVEVEA